MNCKEVNILGISTLIVFDKEKKDVVHESGATLEFGEYGPKIYEIFWNNRHQMVVLLNSLFEYEFMVTAWRCFFRAMKITGASDTVNIDNITRDNVTGTNFYLAYLEIKRACEEMMNPEDKAIESMLDDDHFDYDEYNRS